MQHTLVMLKPDVFMDLERIPEYDSFKKPLGTPDEFLAVVKWYIEGLGFEIVTEKFEVIPKETIEAHYDEHRGSPAKFNFLVKSYIGAGPCHAMVVQWEDAIAKCRQLIMDIRAEYLETPKDARKNMTHASANAADAEREIKLHFNK